MTLLKNFSYTIITITYLLSILNLIFETLIVSIYIFKSIKAQRLRLLKELFILVISFTLFIFIVYSKERYNFDWYTESYNFNWQQGYVYLIIVLILLIRNVYTLTALYNKPYILSLSTIFDALPNAILIFNKKGKILLINKSMTTLMTTLSINAKELINFKIENAVLLMSYDNVHIYRLKNNEVWKFIIEKIPQLSGTSQLTATDISDNWELIEKLKFDNELLAEKSNQIKNTLENIKQISRVEEELETKIRIHDNLGQKITFLLHNLRQGRSIDYESLTSISSILESTIRGKQELDVESEYRLLKNALMNMDIALNMHGNFPKNEKLAKIYMDIINEATSNAIRHGFSKQIDIEFTEENNISRLKIINTGFSNKEFSEGSGIKSMRKKIMKLNGEFNITISPFCINIKVPIN